MPFLLSRCDVGCSPASASSAKARCPYDTVWAQNLGDFFRHRMIWFEFNPWEPGRDDMSTFVCAKNNLNWEWFVLGAQAIPPRPNWLVIDCHVCLTKASLRSGADTNGKIPVAFGIQCQNEVSTLKAQVKQIVREGLGNRYHSLSNSLTSWFDRNLSILEKHNQADSCKTKIEAFQ